MQRVKPEVILDDAYRLNGWDAAQLDARDVSDARAAFSIAVQEVWEAWWWSELMLCRAVPLAQETYVEGSLADWRDESGHVVMQNGLEEDFFLPLPITITGTAGTITNGPAWLGVSDVNPDFPAILGLYASEADAETRTNRISLSGGMTAFAVNPPFAAVFVDEAVGAVRSVTRLDPRRTNNPGPFHFEPTADGALITDLTVLRPFVWARKLTPIITADTFNVATAYRVGGQCYFEGDFWICVVATVPGESPTSKPGSWLRLDLPVQWRWTLARLTYAHLLELDGQKDKASDERQTARVTETLGLNDLIRLEANRATWRARPEVANLC